MNQQRLTVAQARKYSVLNVAQAKLITSGWLESLGLAAQIAFGLPEVDDRYHVWRVPLLVRNSKERAGECVIHAYTAKVLDAESTDHQVLQARVENGKESGEEELGGESRPAISTLKNTVALGDAEDILAQLPPHSADLIFTSPPYFNARPEYHESLGYEEYLAKLTKVIRNAHRVLAEGRFFVINVSPVLLRRASRGEASKRIAVPFDVHRLLIGENYDFIDDIIWVKPEGAGWATGRGRRFAADRNPLQYKPVPVTEYVLVYRKKTTKLIDWNIRHHPDQQAVRESRIKDGYDVTNVWRIKPAHSPDHPAIFPLELAEKVISYYSFKGDVVLDPFAGIGTVGRAAIKSARRFVLIEKDPKYLDQIRASVIKWLGSAAREVQFLNCKPADPFGVLF